MTPEAIQRIIDAARADRIAYDKLKADVAAWRHNYRVLLSVQNEENNRLRETASLLSQELTALKLSIPGIRRKWPWQK